MRYATHFEGAAVGRRAAKPGLGRQGHLIRAHKRSFKLHFISTGAARVVSANASRELHVRNLTTDATRAYLGRKVLRDRRQAALNFTTPPEFRQAFAF